MKIYEYASAPNCRRVRMYMAEKGLDLNIEYVEVDLVKGENLTPEYRLKDVNAKVPVLELDDGTCLAESVAVQRYFEELHPEPPLFGRNPQEKAQVEMWNRRADFNMMFNVGMCFQHTSGIFTDRMTVFPEYGQACGNKALAFFKVLDQHLSDHEFLVGDYFSVADIGMLCSLDFGKVVKLRPDEQEHPHLTRWRNQLSARPSAKV